MTTATLISSVGVQTAITAALAVAGGAHDSTPEINTIQTAFNTMMSDLAYGAQSVQTVKTPPNGTVKTATYTGLPWPQYS